MLPDRVIEKCGLRYFGPICRLFSGFQHCSGWTFLEDFQELFLKSPIQCYIELYRERLRNATVPLPIGKMIPKNFQVLNIKTAKLENLQKYLGKLTVLNFGSCT
ncbi:unnamed protein product [Oikopleura dioica]|uniref:Uncharacterized protein n=1 Tax=Oikopleura dioica TaxID=34765 RepID=E4YXM0_OIKDI|nr:unnamed protein product [Oikopleura dioica]